MTVWVCAFDETVCDQFYFLFFIMKQTLRQIVAVLALAGLAMSLVPNALAATYTDLSAANKLATAKVIVDQSATPAAYRLGETLLRQEGVGTAGKALGIIPMTPVSAYTCMNKFSDVSEAWVCRAAELAAKAGLTNATNTTFRPKDNLTKYEAMLFALRSACMIPIDRSVAGVASFAAEAGIITNAASFNGTAAATRGEFFRYVATAMEDSTCGDTTDEDVLCSLFPDLCVDGGGDEDPTPADGDVRVSLSDETPAGRTLPKGANGVWVASYVIDASEDTTISGVTLSREGLSADADTTGFAILVDGVRMTDSKDENSDDEVMLTLTGGLDIAAGDSVVLDVVIDTFSVADTGAEIAVGLIDVTSAGDVTGLPVVAETFTIGSIAAPSLEVNADGSVSNPKLGEVEADLFRFKVENTSGNDDVYLEAITFEQTGGIDETSELTNYVLLDGSEVLAMTESTDSKYVTFMLDEPLKITEGNSVSLKVSADIVGGAGEDVEFGIDQKLDVVASTTRYGTGVAVTINDLDAGTGGVQSTFASIDVEAGAVSLVKTDAVNTKVREDKDDVVLGSLDIVAGQAGLEVKEIGFTITSTGANLNLLIENVQLRNVITGARYDLADDGSTASLVEAFDDDSIDLGLAVGSNKFEVIVDTLTTIAAFDSKTLTLSMNATTQLVIEETGDDEVVTDVTPSSLTWRKVDGSESSASVSVLPLSDLTRVRGATNVTALQIEIKADESSALTFDELKALVRTNSDDIITGLATNQMVSEVSLYEGTSTTGSPLDSVSGSNLAAGIATFDGFDVLIPANGKKTFTVTVSFVDGAAASDPANSKYRVEVAAANISLEDDENDDVVVLGGPYVSARDIDITDVGSLILTPDANNIDNKEVKNVLGGTTVVVFSADIQAQNESVDVEKVVFNYTGGDLSAAAARAELWLGNEMIATATNADITAGDITFGGTNAGDLTNLIIPQETKELRLAIMAATIGYEKAGLVAKDVDITSVTIATADATGVSSGRDISGAVNSNVAVSSALFSVVPTLVTPSVVTILSNSSATAKVKLTANSGGNTINASSSTPTVSVDSLTFSAPGAAGVVATDYVLYEEGKSDSQIVGQLSGSNILFSFNNAVVATRTVTIANTPLDNETITIGTCLVTFDAVAGSTADDLTCAGGVVIDLDTGPGDVARTPAQLSAILDTITGVTDAGQGSLTVGVGGAATTVFTAPVALTGSIVFTDGTSGDVTTTNTAGVTVFANGTFTTDKTYVIVPTMTGGDTASLTLLKTGLQYDVNVTGATDLTTTLPNELEFGSRTISN